jgi:hypothetical protein
MSLLPFVINFPKIGSSSIGYISVSEKENLPFTPKRIYWTYFTPEELERGGHSHLDLEQILIAVSGIIYLDLESKEGEKYSYVLNSPNIGVFIPRCMWRTMKYSHNAVQLCIASMEYDEDDYIRDYNIFKK